jgi:hypothetical protein
MSFDLLIKSTAIAELIEEVEVIDSLENLDELDNIGALDFRQDLYFVQRTLL